MDSGTDRKSETGPVRVIARERERERDRGRNRDREKQRERESG